MISQAVAEWRDFYMMVGTAGATMVGLLFVALSLDREEVSGKSGAQPRIMATQAFLNFIAVLMFAVVFLIPAQGPLGLGLPLLFMGVSGLVQTVMNVIAMRREHSSSAGHAAPLGPLLGSAVCYLGLIGVSMSVLLGQVSGLYWLVPVMVLLIVAASRSAWSLLLGFSNGRETR